MKCKRCNGTGKEAQPEAIRQKREAKGFTQEQLAAKLRISPSYLSDLEAGRRDWNTRLLQLVEMALGKL